MEQQREAEGGDVSDTWSVDSFSLLSPSRPLFVFLLSPNVITAGPSIRDISGQIGFPGSPEGKSPRIIFPVKKSSEKQRSRPLEIFILR